MTSEERWLAEATDYKRWLSEVETRVGDRVIWMCSDDHTMLEDVLNLKDEFCEATDDLFSIPVATQMPWDECKRILARHAHDKQPMSPEDLVVVHDFQRLMMMCFLWQAEREHSLFWEFACNQVLCKYTPVQYVLATKWHPA